MKPSRFQQSAAATADWKLVQAKLVKETEEDAEIARIISEERSRRRQQAKASGTLAYMDLDPSCATSAVNKRFLGSVVKSVVGHNRRNQEEQCWRAKSLEPLIVGKKSSSIYSSRVGDGGVGPVRKRLKGEEDSPSTLTDRDQPTISRKELIENQVSSREEWAMRKACALQERGSLSEKEMGSSNSVPDCIAPPRSKREEKKKKKLKKR
jgi:hypothetical protein